MCVKDFGGSKAVECVGDIVVGTKKGSAKDPLLVPEELVPVLYDGSFPNSGLVSLKG